MGALTDVASATSFTSPPSIKAEVPSVSALAAWPGLDPFHLFRAGRLRSSLSSGPDGRGQDCAPSSTQRVLRHGRPIVYEAVSQSDRKLRFTISRSLAHIADAEAGRNQDT